MIFCTGTSYGQVMLGILIIQDLALGLMLAVLPALNQPLDQIGFAIGVALLKLALFVLGAIALIDSNDQLLCSNNFKCHNGIP